MQWQQSMSSLVMLFSLALGLPLVEGVIVDPLGISVLAQTADLSAEADQLQQQLDQLSKQKRYV